MDESTGLHQATRILGAQLTLMGGDINKLIAITAQENTARALERQDKAAESERERADLETVEDKQNAIDNELKLELKNFLDAAKAQ